MSFYQPTPYLRTTGDVAPVREDNLISSFSAGGGTRVEPEAPTVRSVAEARLLNLGEGSRITLESGRTAILINGDFRPEVSEITILPPELQRAPLPEFDMDAAYAPAPINENVQAALDAYNNQVQAINDSAQAQPIAEPESFAEPAPANTQDDTVGPSSFAPVAETPIAEVPNETQEAVADQEAVSEVNIYEGGYDPFDEVAEFDSGGNPI